MFLSALLQGRHGELSERLNRLARLDLRRTCLRLGCTMRTGSSFSLSLSPNGPERLIHSHTQLLHDQGSECRGRELMHETSACLNCGVRDISLVPTKFGVALRKGFRPRAAACAGASVCAGFLGFLGCVKIPRMSK